MPNPKATKVHLTKKELLFLRLFIFGYQQNYIKHLMDVKEDEYDLTKKKVQNKLGGKNWHQIIIRAFDLNYLDKNEFLDPFISNRANNYVDAIFALTIVNHQEDNLNLSKKRKIRNEIEKFMISSRKFQLGTLLDDVLS